MKTNNIKILLLILIHFLLLTVFVKCEFVEMSDYYKMPKLFSYENYDKCVDETNDESPYCLVRTIIKPENSSKLWQFIEQFSSDHKRHFRHNNLDKGICVNRCKKLVASLSNETKENLLVEKFPIDFPYTFKAEWYTESIEYKEKYEELINICVNYELKRDYNLSAYSSIELCKRRNDKIGIDALDIIFIIIVLVILGLIILSSWYDRTMNLKDEYVHYSKDLPTKKDMLLVSFSIYRNWSRLTARSREQVNKDFRFFQTIRFLTMYLVILGHSNMAFTIAPSLNPQDQEKFYHSIFVMFFTCGSQVIQSYFLMSGVLLAVQFMAYLEKRKFVSVAYIWHASIYRYIRLTPVYAFIMLFHATWLYKFEDGPIWKRGIEVERHFCRTNWWANLLYINNYVKAEEPCVQQGWYLGTDFQLFIAGMCVLLLISKLPKHMWKILGGCMALTYIIPAISVYINKLDGVFELTLEGLRFSFWFDELYQKTYIPFHMNMGNYLFGIIFGIFYHNYRNTIFGFVQHKIFYITWYGIPLFGLLYLFPSYIFYAYEFSKPAIWISIYFAVVRNFWGILAVFFCFGMIYGIGGPIKRIFDHGIFDVLGKLTYSAYLVHIFILKLTFFNIRGQSYFSALELVSRTNAAILTSYIIAFFLCLSLELPVTALQKQLLDPKKKSTGSNQNQNQNQNGENAITINVLNNNNNNVEAKG